MNLNSNFTASLREKIREYVEKSIPGAYYLHDLYCRKHEFKDCASLIFEEPSKFKQILVEIYGQQTGIELIIRIYLTPIITELNPDRSINDLVRLFVNNPNEFKKLINTLLKKKTT